MMNQSSLRGLAVGVLLLSFMVESISAFSSSTVAWRPLHLRSSSSTTRTALTLRVDEDDDFPDPHALMEYLDGPSELDSDGTGGTGEFLSFQDFQELQRKQQYLRSCPIFRDCSEGDLSRIAKSMVLQKVSPGEHLVKQGETGASAMYFLKSGSLQAVGRKTPATTKDGNDDDNDDGKKDQQGAQAEPETVIYTTYSKEGSFFGELALLFGQPRAASIVAVDGSAVYRLDKEAFATSIVDSPVYDTAKRMILAKYKSKRLRDILPKIRLDELLGLVKARMMTPKIRSIRSWLLTLRSYSLGACATLLALKYVQTEALKPVVILAMGVLAHVL